MIQEADRVSSLSRSEQYYLHCSKEGCHCTPNIRHLFTGESQVKPVYFGQIFVNIKIWRDRLFNC